jgi:hypothetical protein
VLHVCRAKLKNDLSHTDWAATGQPTNTKPMVGPMSADNFLLVAHAQEVQISNGVFLEYNVKRSIIYAWLRAHGLQNCGVKAAFSMDTHKTFGKKKSQPNCKYKVSTADIELGVLLKVLNDKDAMADLARHNIYFFDIDIKADFACCITKKVVSHVERDASSIFPDLELKLSSTPYNPNTCVVLHDNQAGIRAKAYNKFTETIENAGVRKAIGDQVHRWGLPRGMKKESKAIKDPRTSRRLRALVSK